MLVSPWRWVAAGITFAPLLGSTSKPLYFFCHFHIEFSLAFSIIMMTGNIKGVLNNHKWSGPIPLWYTEDGQLYAFYISLGSNFVLSTALVTRIWMARREALDLLGRPNSSQSQIPYAKVISILLESALPPLVLGVSHLIIWQAFDVMYYTHGAPWLSFTVRH
jgi:hypothetical protein